MSEGQMKADKTLKYRLFGEKSSEWVWCENDNKL